MKKSRGRREKPVQSPQQPNGDNQETRLLLGATRSCNARQSKAANQPFFSRLETWIVEHFAVLGDSGTALFASCGIMCLAWYLRTASSSSISFPSFWRNTDLTDPYLELGPVPEIGPAIVYMVNGTSRNGTLLISDEIRAAYAKDGVVAIRGLLSKEMLEQLDLPSQSLLNPKPRKGGQFHTVHHSSLFTEPAFWQVAVESDVPQAAYQLLQHVVVSPPSSTKTPPHAGFTTLRVLRDIFLVKDPDDAYICGWHVDDLGFWPATPESPGINAWIALEENQSSFAVAVGSHIAKWRHQAYYETGASVNFPPGGYRDAADYLAHRTGSGTCNLKTAAPHMHRRMEETARLYTLQPGDVVFHTRWLFHRTVVREPVSMGGSPQSSSPRTHDKSGPRLERRYSVRYGPGSSVIPPGYGTEPSVLWDPTHGGKTADEICANDGPWYPQVWPVSLDIEKRAVPALVRDQLSVALQRRHAHESELAPLVRALARKMERSQSQSQRGSSFS